MEESVHLSQENDSVDDPVPEIQDQRDLIGKGSIQVPLPGGATPKNKKESRNIGIKNQSVGVSKTEMSLPKIEMTQNDFNKMDSLEISPLKAGTAGTTLTRNESNLTPWNQQ